jgi:L-2-hydroxyglutarate oxidase LhgO
LGQTYDVTIIGGGVIGLSVARALLHQNKTLKLAILEKELVLGTHASGRNSGVLHAGFYYSPDSLKAKFCLEGNIQLTELAARHKIPVRRVGKVVVARNKSESERIDLLYRRGITNGVKLELLPSDQLPRFEPLAKSFDRFLWSPNTAVSDPSRIIEALATEVKELGGNFFFGSRVKVDAEQRLFLNEELFKTNYLVNCSGSGADRIAHDFNVGKEFSMVPFLGVYRYVPENKLPLKTLVYPVPHPLNPFLGVHFTLTSDYKVKIGPSAIPVLGREQYKIWNKFKLRDGLDTSLGLFSLLKGEHHNVPEIIKTEVPKFLTSTLIRESSELVPSVIEVKGWKKKPPGIRSQLVNLQTGKLEQDFLVLDGNRSTHVLNAVSPGWTSCIPFGKWIADGLNI